MLVSSRQAPAKHASNDDYTTSFMALTTFMLVLATLAIVARIYLRIWTTKFAFGLDDALAVVAYVCQRSILVSVFSLRIDSNKVQLGFLTNVIAHYFSTFPEPNLRVEIASYCVCLQILTGE
jgi:hypothetical protein